MKNEIRVAIITVTYNDADNLLRTLNSIRKNKKDYHDYYVIDGCSSDRTLDLLRENEDIITSWMSEKDNGIYDAMNKCLNFHINDNTHFLWLNAGDELLDWSDLSFLDTDCIFCSVIKKISVESRGVLSVPIIKEPYDCINFFPESLFMHQGFMIRKKVFQKYLYDLNVGIQAENLLMSKCIQHEHYSCIESPISIYYLDGISNSRFGEILMSYIKVAAALGYKKTSFYWYKRVHLIKLLLLSILPSTFWVHYAFHRK